MPEQRPSPYNELVARALEVAAKAHEGQFRRSEGEIPYFSHCAAVALILTQAGYSEDVVIAGILHDVLEDTDFPRDEIVNQFGQPVLDLVEFVTEPSKNFPWVHRKEAYVRKLAGAPSKARAISAADKIHNIRSVLSNLRKDEPIFDRLNQGPREQLAQWRRLLEVLSDGWKSPLLTELGRSIDKVEAELQKRDSGSTS